MRIHDRYVLGDFWRNLAIGLIAFTVIYVTVDVNEQIDDYIDFHARFADIVAYYLYKIPWIVVLIMPIAVLLATVFSLGKLSRLNELTAFIASGTSLARVAAPLIVSALALSVAVMAFGEFALPQANRRGERIKSVNIKHENARVDERYRDNVHYQGEKGRTYYAERFDMTLATLTNVIVHEYEGTRLSRRIDAKKAVWDGTRWNFMDGAVREFANGGERVMTFARLTAAELPERPEDFMREEIAPDEMNARELGRYIDRLRRSGGPVDKYLVDLYVKFSFPFTNFIFAVIGAALASAKRKPSMATGFGLTLFISFTYYGVLRIGQSLGHAGTMSPVAGAWLGNVIFLALGAALLYRANQ